MNLLRPENHNKTEYPDPSWSFLGGFAGWPYEVSSFLQTFAYSCWTVKRVDSIATGTDRRRTLRQMLSALVIDGVPESPILFLGKLS